MLAAIAADRSGDWEAGSGTHGVAGRCLALMHAHRVLSAGNISRTNVQNI